ncbi:MAG: phosphatase PAP2 family protein [Chitinophagaceae bacterium]|nr:phosphatase PAP2 family protein [Chitinophagaceae bacterium]
MKNVLLALVLLLPGTLFSQSTDSLSIEIRDTTIAAPQKVVYRKPRLFSFIIDIPKDVAGFTRNSFQKKQIKDWAIIGGSTAVLFLADQVIANSVQSTLTSAGIHGQEDFSPIVQLNIGGKKTNLGKMPNNLNTAFYNFGQGSSTMLFAAGFFVLGKIKKDNRALQTASQLTEAFITMGAATQLIKYATGRENPSDATAIRGSWRPFPAWSDFQGNKTRYDAFPSGHLATFVSTVTIIGENYPEIRWIKPVGYSIAGLIGLSMINNGVHWASDFPLGFALGYGFGKFISKKTRFTLVN